MVQTHLHAVIIADWQLGFAKNSESFVTSKQENWCDVPLGPPTQWHLAVTVPGALLTGSHPFRSKISGQTSGLLLLGFPFPLHHSYRCLYPTCVFCSPPSTSLFSSCGSHSQQGEPKEWEPQGSVAQRWCCSHAVPTVPLSSPWLILPLVTFLALGKSTSLSGI